MAARVTSKALLRRYTSIPSLLAILANRELTLLSPSTWDDRNDRNFMEAFARASRFKSSLALCFAQAPETYHHWKIFAPDSAGVRIDFDKEALLRAVPRGRYSHGSMKYMTVLNLLDAKLKREDLAFVKRWAFRDEKEYRIVYGPRTANVQSKAIPIDLHMITGVVVNPWMPKPLFEATKNVIEGIKGCEHKHVSQSAVIDHDVWRQYADEYAWELKGCSA